MRSTLLLNASYEPLSVISAQRAVTLIVQGKARVEDESPAVFKAANGETINVPYVAVLNKNIRRKSSLKAPRFSRRGVLVRDNFTCAYCGNYGDTIDHVIPRSMGGGSTYENCVAACGPCNRKKSNKSLREIGWTLNRSSLSAPSLYENILNKAHGNDEVFKVWNKYVEYYIPKRHRV